MVLKAEKAALVAAMVGLVAQPAVALTEAAVLFGVKAM
jgi:hypothetical protein